MRSIIPVNFHPAGTCTVNAVMFNAGSVTGLSTVFDQSWGSVEVAAKPLADGVSVSSATGEADALFLGWLKHPETTRAARTAALRNAADSNFIVTSKAVLWDWAKVTDFVF
jgi:hypothetical protein